MEIDSPPSDTQIQKGNKSSDCVNMIAVSEKLVLHGCDDRLVERESYREREGDIGKIIRGGGVGIGVASG